MPVDHVKAARWYREAATRGDREAQRCLGRCCSKGQGVPQSWEEAAAWYERASAQGDPTAQW